MPKCENCYNEKGESNFEPLYGSVGHCKVHNCMRKINDSCSPEEIARGDDWGASEAVMNVAAAR
jgi:hypothetical protein